MPLNRDVPSRAADGPPGAAIEEAIAWSIRLGSGDVGADERLAFEHWRTRDATHEHAWRSVQEIDDVFVALVGTQRDVALRTLDAISPVRSTRRRRLLGSGLVAIAALAVGRFAWQARATRQDFASGAQRRDRLVLRDGSFLYLDVRTAVTVSITSLEREIHLERGQILIETGHDRGRPFGYRPFIVTTPHASMEALGTRFDVRVDGDSTSVAVVVGRVAMRVDGSEPVVGEPGGQFVIARSIEHARDTGLDPSAWADGNLIARDVRLDVFVTELSRYTNRRLACASEIASLRVSGVFQLDGDDATMRNANVVARTLGLVVQSGRANEPIFLTRR